MSWLTVYFIGFLASILYFTLLIRFNIIKNEFKSECLDLPTVIIIASLFWPISFSWILIKTLID